MITFFGFLARGLSVLLAVAIAVLLLSPAAFALSIGFAPSDQAVTLGDSVGVDLVIEGLGLFSPDSLSTFDVDISFDPSILSFTDATFGDPILGDQLDLFGLGSLFDVTSGTGTVNLWEVSLDLPDDLDTMQYDSFVLASLSFSAVGLGISPLDISVNYLGDSMGLPLDADLISGRVTVAPVPEPATVLLFGSGVAGLILIRKRLLKRKAISHTITFTLPVILLVLWLTPGLVAAQTGGYYELSQIAGLERRNPT